MTREEAIKRLEVVRTNALIQKANGASEYWQEEIDGTIEAIDMAIEALSANATVAKIKIDDIDKAKTSSQLLDDLAVDMVNAMGKRIVDVVRCKDCEYKRLYEYDEGEPKYYYCALEDRPNRNWSVDDTDFCSWGERREK